MTQEISLQHVGPIGRDFKITLPDGYGVVQIEGDNGAGKTTALAAVDRLLGAKTKTKVSTTDGKLLGSIEAFGGRMTFGERAKKTGELDVLTLEGRFDIADLVDPGIDKPESADEHRIKALLRLTGAEADAALFHKSFGGQAAFEAVVSSDAIQTTDLVTMAAKVKRSAHQAAQAQESQRDIAKGHANAAKNMAATVSLDAPDDAEQLQEGLLAAITEEGKLKNQYTTAREAARRAEQAKQQLEQATASYKGPSVKEAQVAIDGFTADMEAARHKIEEYESLLAEAKSNWGVLQNAYDRAIERRDAAQQHAKLVSSCQSILAEATAVQGPAGDELLKAATAVGKARTAVETGALVREAKKRLAHAQTYEAQAEEFAQAAIRLRQAADATDDVLSAKVSSSLLRVSGGRLITDTERGETFFADLSDGQRWKIAIDLAVERVGPGGVIVLRQEAWQGLSETNRQLVHVHAKSKQVWILTAIAKSVPLRAVPLEKVEVEV